MYDKLTKILAAYEDLEAKLGDPAVLADQKEYTRLAKEHARQGELATAAREYISLSDQLASAKDELKNESEKWKVEVIDASPSDMGGFKEISFKMLGDRVYSSMKFESGVHRVQRVPKTESQGRIHTSTATVAVLPEADEVEVDIKPEDLRIDVYRAGGPGGQCVNTTDSAVRITHLPTGIVVTCQNERSQLQNKATAMGILRSKLYELEQEKRANELDELRGPKHEISFGNQIRNYVLYPYQMVKDLRSGVETGNVDAVFDGDIDEFVVGYHQWRVSEAG